MNKIFEIAWREYLIKRLDPVIKALQRDRRKERKEMENAVKLAAGFDSVNDAREAYGWEGISASEFQRVKDLFERPLNDGEVQKALQHLAWFVDRLRGDITVIITRGNSKEAEEEISIESDAVLGIL